MRTHRLLARAVAPLVLAALGPAGAPAPTEVGEPSTPPELQAGLEALLERGLPATVRVILPDASGSGVVVSSDGLVLTAAHVAKRAGEAATVVFSDGTQRAATTLGGNASRDTALLRIHGAVGLPHVEVPAPGPLAPGGWCVALGFPRGGVEGEPAVPRLGRLRQVSGRFLSSDCALISGDSGGPLFDLDGDLIGVHSRIELDVATNYHAPTRSFRLGWERLLAGERWSTGSAQLGLLGVSSVEGGARVGPLSVGGPAEHSALREGDVIVALNGEQVYDAEELGRLLWDLSPGQTVTLSTLRAGRAISVELILGDRGTGRPADVRSGGRVAGPSLAPGRDSAVVRAAFTGAARGHAESVASVVVDGRARALATVVDADGWLLSKASEVGLDPVCVLHDGRALPALVVARDPHYDLALLRVDARDLVPVVWERDPVAPGRVVVAAGTTGAVLGIGVVGVAPRAITGGEGELGLVLAFGVEGAIVAHVVPDTPADLAGVLSGDRVVCVGNSRVESRVHARELLGAYEAGEAVRLELERDGVRVLMAPVLAARSDVGGRSRRERLEGDRSDLRGGFPSALQHDVVLAPEECGGPLLDLAGRVVGLNIARAGRVATYAVPSGRIDVLVASLRLRALELVSEDR